MEFSVIIITVYIGASPWHCYKDMIFSKNKPPSLFIIILKTFQCLPLSLISSKNIDSQACYNKVPQTGDLKREKFVLLQFWQLGAEIKVLPRPYSLQDSGQNLPLFLLSIWWWPSILSIPGMQLHYSKQCLYDGTVFSLCLHMTFPPSYKDTSHIGLRPTLMTSLRSHWMLDYLNVITSTKTIFE